MVLPLISLTLLSDVPTPAAILAKTEQAYARVRTFEQDVKADMGGNGGTAHILFSRPGRLQVKGSTMFGTPYELLADGKAVWVFNADAWQEVASVELGIASITGISATSGTLVPGLLTGSDVGGLNPKGAQGMKAKVETVAGKRLWRVDRPAPFPSTTWIDPATGFVVRTRSKLGEQTVAVSYDVPKVNLRVPATRFEKR